MKFISIAVLFLSSSAMAIESAYELKIDLALHGKHVSSPHLLVQAGKTATYEQKSDTGSSFISVTASESTLEKKPGVMMEFTVGTIGQSGEKIILSQPKILARENMPAHFSTKETTSGAEQVSLSVVATKRHL